MLVVRPAGLADFDALMELAVLSGRGFTSLPEDEPTLARRVWRCRRRASSPSVAPPRGLVHPDAGGPRHRLRRGRGRRSRRGWGVKRPFFSFRVVTLAQSSPTLEMRFDHKALVLVNECAGWSEVGSLFLRPEKRKGGAGRLCWRSRATC